MLTLHPERLGERVAPQLIDLRFETLPPHVQVDFPARDETLMRT